MADQSMLFPYGRGMRQQQKPAASTRNFSRFSTRQYAAGKNSRLTADWRPTNSSADSELVTSLTTLRSRCRQLVRDASFAKRARIIVVNNVIGSGIGMQAQVMNSRGELNQRVNADIEEAWCEWSEAENCHTGGRLALKHFERACMGQVFDAGEVFVRKHYRAFGDMGVPFALELIEAERIADQLTMPSPLLAPGNQFRMGIEVDEFYKPVAYWIRRRHPGELRFSGEAPPDQIERVPADQIIHLSLVDRWPQTRGEPWLHTAARRLNDMEGYSEAEIVRARAEASISGAIETPEDAETFGEEQDDGTFEMETEAGIFKRLNPGEKFVLPARTSPNSAMDPFMRLLLREVAAGSGTSYESLSRDYSQSNYSSSRLALLDDRDLWKFYQSWFICDFRKTVHREWLRATVLAQKIPSISIESYALDSRKFEAVQWKPRGWSWIDPKSEVEAYKEAVRCGFTTVSDIISKTQDGQDLDDILTTRRRELDLMKEMNLTFETDPQEFNDKGQSQPAPPDPNGADNENAAEAAQEQTQNPAPSRVFSFRR